VPPPLPPPPIQAHPDLRVPSKIPRQPMPKIGLVSGHDEQAANLAPGRPCV